MMFFAKARNTLVTYVSALTLGVSAALVASPVAAQDTITWKVQAHWPAPAQTL